MRRNMWGVMVLALVALASQVAWGQDYRRAGPSPSVKRVGNAANRTVVFVADGVGQAQLAENLSAASQLDGVNYTTRVIPWAKTGIPRQDYQDCQAQLLGAARMAFEVMQLRQTNPGVGIVLMGYCAGGRVVLAAAEQLPPGAVDRVILLSPAVSTNYDVRPTIRASRQGVDVFYAPDDGFLEAYESEIGTVEGKQGITAGRAGFSLGRNFPCLRQYSVEGGHFATINVNLLAQRVVPLFPTNANAGCVPPATIPVPAPPQGQPVPPPALPYPPTGPANVPPYGPQGPIPPAPNSTPLPPPAVPGPYGPQGPVPPVPNATPLPPPAIPGPGAYTPAGPRPTGPVPPAPNRPVAPPQAGNFPPPPPGVR